MPRIAGLLLLWTVAAVIAGAACTSKPAQPPPDQTYTIRGVVSALPEAGRPTSQLMIRHEAVPDFKDKDGKVVGMAAMEMPFTPAQGVSLKGLAIGDPVEFTLEVRWKQSQFLLTRIEKRVQ